MSTMNVDVPDSLLKQVRQLAEQENMTLEQFISSALAEKVSTLRTVEYLRQRAARGNRADFERALNDVPDTEPSEADKL